MSGWARSFLAADRDVASGHATALGGFGDLLGHRGGDVAVERAGDDVVGIELVVRDDRGDRTGRGQLHLLVDRRCAHVESTAEDTGEGEHVVDLVGVVRAPRGHDPHVVADVLGLHLRGGIGHGEDDRSRGHRADGGRRDGTGRGQSEVDVGAREQLVGRALLAPGVGALGERCALGVEVRTTAVQRSLAVAHDDVRGSLGEDDVRARHPRRAGARHDDPRVLHALADHAQRVEQRREDDDRGSVLVVVEHRDVELRAQPTLDLEAARRGDVLQVDAAERGRQRADDADDLVDVGRVQAERKRVDPGEFLEQHRLALHHRHRGLGADVAQPEHRGPVGDHGDHVALDGQRPCSLDVFVDRVADARNARGVGHREVVARLHRDVPVDVDLAALMHLEGSVQDALHRDAVDLADRVDDALAVRRIDARDGDLADLHALLDLHQVDRAEDRPGVPDGRRHLAERACPRRKARADDDAVGRRRLDDRRVFVRTSGAVLLERSSFTSSHRS